MNLIDMVEGYKLGRQKAKLEGEISLFRYFEAELSSRKPGPRQAVRE